MKRERRDNWHNRRRMVITCLVFVAGMTVYLAVWGKNDDLRQDIADGLLTTAMWLVLGYTGGAIVDDHLKRGGKFNELFGRDQVDSDRDFDPRRDRDDGMAGRSQSQQGDSNIGPE